MNATKQKILIESLRLFNDYGISNVSLRTIADEAGISVGNLQYHFRKREDIIEVLYFQIVEKIDSISLMKTDDLLESFFNISKEISSILYEYRFFLLDFITITRKNQKIKSHYSELSKRREIEFLEIVDVLVENGLFRKELLKNEYHSLFKRIEVISNFWFSSILIQVEVLSKDSIEGYLLLISQSLYPYLTDEAKKQYVTVFPDQFASS